MRIVTLSFLTSILLTTFSTASAQTFEEYQRAQMASYSKYKEERDKEFNDYLTKEWKAYQLYSGKKLYEKPKPKTIPKAKTIQDIPVGPKVNIVIPKDLQKISPIVVTKPADEAVTPPKKVVEPVKTEPEKKIVVEGKKPETVEKELEEPKTITPPVVSIPKKETVQRPLIPVKEVKTDPDALDVRFFGTNVQLVVPQSMRNVRLSSHSQKGIASFFEQLATAEYDKLIKSINEQNNNLRLNDWGNYQLLKALSKRLYRNKSEATLFTWFLMNKQGYAVKIGLSGNTPVLLVYSKKLIYSTPNYSFGKQRYYALEYYATKGVGSLRTYPERYPDANKPLDMALKNMPKLENDIQTKTLMFRHRGAAFNVDVSYDQNLIDFMATYPQADYATYFNAPVSENNQAMLAKQLKPMLDGKQYSSAINFLLYFVQNAFEYQVDQKQFGREKVMFADETLYYKASDCEDRAVLFAYLVKNLLNINVIGVKYKDHMATAIYVPLKGDGINVGNKRFIIADPTYINASAGQSMPQYKNVRPEKFIPIY